MTWIAVLAALPTLFTLVKQLVEDFETDQVPGEKKKEAVLQLLKAAIDATGSMGITIPASILLTLAAALIDALVAGYNLIGKFRKKSPAPAAAPAG